MPSRKLSFKNSRIGTIEREYRQSRTNPKLVDLKIKIKHSLSQILVQNQQIFNLLSSVTMDILIGSGVTQLDTIALLNQTLTLIWVEENAI